MGLDGKPEKSGKEKPHFVDAEKKTLSQAKDKVIVIIPPILGIRPFVVEPPLAVIIPIDIENARVPVGISLYAAPSFPLPTQKWSNAVFYSGARLRQRRIPSLFFLKS